MTSINDYSAEIDKIKDLIKNADAILIGAGAGLSTAAGFTYSGERFQKHFADFGKKYGFDNMYYGGFYPFPSPEEKWAYWSRYIYINRYENAPKPVYDNLFRLVKDKEYFVITTNVDHCFQKAGFDKNRLFYTQGDYGLFQCSKPCHNKTYDNEEIIKKMYAEQRDMCIPSYLIPKCPVCGREMSMNLRADDTFVEDEGWHAANERYTSFVEKYINKKIVFLELGVGGNTPVIIKYPFWRMTYANPKATYVCINYGEAICPDQIKDRSLCIDADISDILQKIL
ncbi:MAG: Sir2 silent information regulator family NAD-dependent deacetylase [Clostridia bacterium]|nr:Sir2 silent information regulator family NAD-dependent deacetylase [Clostridia bacterium]